ncbi:hypothetical protein OM076_10455 [Solirubrobacter ginsenosidimutans]|uniref:Bacterial Ig-like domain-containing protein n=1 Tax=Solirubrobacter ginsenosidimutans TaxID=490573 RepID=A0A9X3MPW7_9ACTN|nr:hypothetical protein [Solirubrobacter ginsenosidimutans]MDA0160686.1 hypothetical protein [Solirubrobacter ginsenosidimutans]
MRHLLVAAVLGLAFLATAAPARAGTYEVRSCGTNSASAFVLSNDSPSTLATGTQCPQNGSQLLSGVFAGVSNATFTLAGSGASWTIAAPPGLLLQRLDVRRSIGRLNSAWNVEVSTPERVLEGCGSADSSNCKRGNAGGEAMSYPDLGSRSVTFRVECRPSDEDVACVGRQNTQAWVAIYSATAQVADPAPPVLSPLLASGWQSGSDSIDLQASDAGGVKSLSLFAGDTKLFERQQACDYSRMQPCPPSQHETASVDTSKLTDGTYQLKAVATDAADQPGTATSVLKVDGTAPTAPTGLVLSRNPDGTYGLTWVDPDQGTAAPIAAAHVQVCDGATCDASKVFAGSGINRVGSLDLPAGERTLKVWLEDEAGNANAANAATLTVDPTTIEAPNVLQTRPPVLESGSIAPPKFRVTKARRSGSTLTLSGTIAKGAKASITAKLAKAIRTTTLTTAKAKPKNGKWSLKLKLSSSLRRANSYYVSVSFAGESAFGKSTLRRRLAKKAGRTELSLQSVR